MKEIDQAARELLAFFSHDHLPADLQEIVAPFEELAWAMAHKLEGDQLIAGLWNLLHAKDCMVRASLAMQPGFGV